jgi:hypothetical protein
MKKEIQTKKIRFKKLTDHQKELRIKVASEIMSGLVASRGQHPLNNLSSNAAEIAKTACDLTDALLSELEA